MDYSRNLNRQAAPDGDNRSIIIVEDEALVSEVIEMLAGDLGWEIAGTAYSGGAALSLLDKVRPTVAVIDINLGATTSFDVSAACHVRGVPVLFVTGFTAEDIPKECGDDPILAKPFSIEDFSLALGRCLQGQNQATV